MEHENIRESVEKKLQELDTPAAPVEIRSIVAAYEAACDYALQTQCPVPEFAALVGIVGNIIYSDPDEYETTVDYVRFVIKGVPLDRIIKRILAVTRPTVADCRDDPTD
jgi:hypothetical protein